MFKEKFRSMLKLITQFLNIKTSSIEQLESRSIEENQSELNVQGSYIFAKKAIINIPNSEPLILERVYISNEPIKLAGAQYISLEINNKNNGGNEKFCINREAIVLLEI